jgi:catechol 2,3-dioxygenase
VEHIDEPIYDVAHLSHIELLTPRPEESQRFFTDVLSLQVVGQQGQSVYLRGYGDYERFTLTLTEAPVASREFPHLRDAHGR